MGYPSHYSSWLGRNSASHPTCSQKDWKMHMLHLLVTYLYLVFRRHLVSRVRIFPLKDRPGKMLPGFSPWNLTCHLKREHFRRKIVFQPSFFRGYFSFTEEWFGGFLKWWVPPNHPLKIGVFHEKKHPFVPLPIYCSLVTVPVYHQIQRLNMGNWFRWFWELDPMILVGPNHQTWGFLVSPRFLNRIFL